MLLQGPAPDPKCKLNISPFFKYPYPLDCLICAKNIMIIVLLLHMMEEWKGWGWLIYFRVWVGVQEVSVIVFLCWC